MAAASLSSLSLSLDQPLSSLSLSLDRSLALSRSASEEKK